MNVPSNIFREYDIRGEAETDLSSQNVLAIARSYGTYLSRKGITKASVGGDVRISTERIRNDVIQGLIDTGIDVIDVGTDESSAVLEPVPPRYRWSDNDNREP
jgi:phosphomannomutase/phosphoglucomutase